MSDYNSTSIYADHISVTDTSSDPGESSLTPDNIQQLLPIGWNYYPLQPQGASDMIMILSTEDQGPAGKIIDRDEQGQWAKSAGANRAHYYAEICYVPDIAAMQRVLDALRPDQCIVLGAFPHLVHGAQINVVSHNRMAQLLNLQNGSGGSLAGLFVDPEGHQYACRFEANVSLSTWRLLDVDIKPETPTEWRAWTPEQLRQVFASVMPEFANVGMVMLPSAASRVVDAAGQQVMTSGGSYHCYFQSEHGIADGWQATLRIRLINAGYFCSVKIARGHRIDAPFDMSVMRGAARLSFDGAPALTQRAVDAGAQVLPSSTRLIPGGRLAVSQIPPLAPGEKTRYEQVTGTIVASYGDTWRAPGMDPGAGAGAGAHAAGSGSTAEFVVPEAIGMDDEFESKDGMITMREFIASGQRKTRIQVPWRDSTSWNGYLAYHKSGIPFGYDNGSATKYLLDTPGYIEVTGFLESIPEQAPKVPVKSLDTRAAAIEEIPARVREEIEGNLAQEKSLANVQWREMRQGLKQTSGYTLQELDQWRRLIRGYKKDQAKEQEQERKQQAKERARLAEEQEQTQRLAMADALRQRRYQFAQGLIEYGDPASLDRLSIKSVGDGGEDEAAGVEIGDGGLKIVFPSVHNVELILRTGCGHVYPKPFYNELKGTVEIVQPPPGEPWCVREIKDVDLNRLHADMGRDFDARFSRDHIAQQLEVVAERNAYHPVRNYLVELVWDGVPRLDRWLSTVVGCPGDEYHRSVGRLMLVAAVGRALEPGIKYDHLPILGGRQGGFWLTKSTLVRTLAKYDEWFADVRLDPRDLNRSIQEMHGNWWIEIGELVGFGKAAVEDIKQAITRQVDRYRRPYARYPNDEKRGFVMTGTTNDTEYLVDVTGNRRFLPVRCERTDLDWLRGNLDQLYAEARVAFTEGEPLYLRPEIVALAEEVQEDYRIEDPWEGIITAQEEQLLAWRRQHLAGETLDPMPMDTQRKLVEKGMREDTEPDGRTRVAVQAGMFWDVLWIAVGCADPSKRNQAAKRRLNNSIRALQWAPGKKCAFVPKGSAMASREKIF